MFVLIICAVAAIAFIGGFSAGMLTREWIERTDPFWFFREEKE